MKPVLLLIIAFVGVICYDYPLALSNLANYSTVLLNLGRHQDECTTKALEQLLPVCIESGVEHVSTDLRRLVAVKLAICEFKNSNILFPSSCHNLPLNIDFCILDLEKSPQFWTSFSGYYRDIDTICFQASVPYQKDHILQLYYNISSIHEQMVVDFHQFHQHSKVTYQEWYSKFQELSLFANVSFEQFYGVLTSSNESLHHFDEYMHQFVKTWMGSVKFTTNEMSSNLNDIANNLASYSQMQQVLADTLQNSGIIETTTELQNTIFNHYTQFDDASNKLLSQILDKIEGVDIVTTQTTNELTKLNQDIIKSNALSHEVVSNLIQSEAAIQNQMNLMSQYNTMAANFTDAIDDQINSIFQVATTRINTLFNDTFGQIETRLAQTEMQLDFINNNLSGLSLFSSKLGSSVKGIHKAISTSPVVMITRITFEFVSYLYSGITSTSGIILSFVQTISLLTVCILVWVLYNKLPNFTKALKVSNLAMIIKYITMAAFLSIGISVAVLFKYILELCTE